MTTSPWLPAGHGRSAAAAAAAAAFARRREDQGRIVLDVVTWPEEAASWLRQASRFAAADPDLWSWRVPGRVGPDDPPAAVVDALGAGAHHRVRRARHRARRRARRRRTADQAASWKTRPSVWRWPDLIADTPWRTGAADHPRAERTGLSLVVNRYP